MSDEQSLQQPVCPPLQSTPKKSWEPPELIILPVSNTSNNSSGGGDGDSAMATDS